MEDDDVVECFIGHTDFLLLLEASLYTAQRLSRDFKYHMILSVICFKVLEELLKYLLSL